MSNLNVETLKNSFTPNEAYGYYSIHYDDLVERLGGVVAKPLMLGDYSGDLLYVIRDPATNLYGFVHTGYGSCSGCDALENAKGFGDEVNWAEVLRLVESLRPTQWMTDLGMISWLQEHDWEGDYYGTERSKEIQDWVLQDIIPALIGRGDAQK